MTILYNTQDGQSSFPIGQNSLPKGRLVEAGRIGHRKRWLICSHFNRRKSPIWLNHGPKNRCTAAIFNRASILSCRIRAKNKTDPCESVCFLVEAGRIELPSENPSTRLSTSVSGVLTFPLPLSLRQDSGFSSFISPARRKA